MSPAEYLPSDVVRVFVGNLVPTITDAALLRLFSRFGETSKLERHSRGFAHLSIQPKDGKATNDIERGISTLNKTSWCGTTLRVEGAQEHYLRRLKREWAEEQHQDDGAMEIVGDKPQEEHFAKFERGKHIRFSFPDLEPSTANLKSPKEDQGEEMDTAKLNSGLADQNELDTNLSRQETPANFGPAKSVKLDSTFALFGLSSNSVEGPKLAARACAKKRHDPPHGERPAKRPRGGARNEEHEEHVEDVIEGRSAIDIGSEKAAARMVLQKLFPESRPTPSNSASCRRLGLYRKLLQESDGESNRDKGRARKHDETSFHVSELPRPAESAGSNTALRFRRAGLFRMLKTQVLSK